MADFERHRLLRANVDRLSKKLTDKRNSEDSFFRSEYEKPYRVWLQTGSPTALQEFYNMLRNSEEFGKDVKKVARHAEDIAIKVVMLYSKNSPDDKLEEFNKFIDIVMERARGKIAADKDYMKHKMKI